MSEALNDLEKELGLDLFIRHKAIGVTLTGAGAASGRSAAAGSPGRGISSVGRRPAATSPEN